MLLYKDMKHRVICPTVDINEGVCKDLGSHKGGTWSAGKSPGSSLQFHPSDLTSFTQVIPHTESADKAHNTTWCILLGHFCLTPSFVLQGDAHILVINGAVLINLKQLHTLIIYEGKSKYSVSWVTLCACGEHCMLHHLRSWKVLCKYVLFTLHF